MRANESKMLTIRFKKLKIFRFADAEQSQSQQKIRNFREKRNTFVLENIIRVPTRISHSMALKIFQIFPL